MSWKMGRAGPRAGTLTWWTVSEEDVKKAAAFLEKLDLTNVERS